jgi:hypothetical protein
VYPAAGSEVLVESAVSVESEAWVESEASAALAALASWYS